MHDAVGTSSEDGCCFSSDCGADDFAVASSAPGANGGSDGTGTLGFEIGLTAGLGTFDDKFRGVFNTVACNSNIGVLWACAIIANVACTHTQFAHESAYVDHGGDWKAVLKAEVLVTGVKCFFGYNVPCVFGDLAVRTQEV